MSRKTYPALPFPVGFAWDESEWEFLMRKGFDPFDIEVQRRMEAHRKARAA